MKKIIIPMPKLSPALNLFFLSIITIPGFYPMAYNFGDETIKLFCKAIDDLRCSFPYQPHQDSQNHHGTNPPI
jgi:hypothetical protein